MEVFRPADSNEVIGSFPKLFMKIIVLVPQLLEETLSR